MKTEARPTHPVRPRGGEVEVEVERREGGGEGGRDSEGDGRASGVTGGAGNA